MSAWTKGNEETSHFEPPSYNLQGKLGTFLLIFQFYPKERKKEYVFCLEKKRKTTKLQRDKSKALSIF